MDCSLRSVSDVILYVYLDPGPSHLGGPLLILTRRVKRLSESTGGGQAVIFSDFSPTLSKRFI